MPARTRRALSVAVLLGISGCTCVENAILGEPEKIAPPREALPELFAPLRWETPEEQLPRLFPGTELYDGPGFGEPFWRWYRSQGVEMDVAPMGHVEVEIQYVAPGHGDAPPTIAAVTARRADPRPECAAKVARQRCRAAPKALVETFDRMSRVLAQRYGRGDVEPDTAAGERTITWPRDGFTIALRLVRDLGPVGETDEDTRWRLELAAETSRAF